MSILSVPTVLANSLMILEFTKVHQYGSQFFLTGKAPPNLPPGVPPLLPNPYIMAPGLLHAYPVGPCQGSDRCFAASFLAFTCSLCLSQPQVYGYDDLQMLQTRIPLVSLVWYLHKHVGLVSLRELNEIFLAGLLQHPVCNTHHCTDWQRRQPDKQPLFR